MTDAPTLPRKLLDVACRIRVGETLFRDDELVDAAAHALKDAAAEIERLTAALAWQPIETAPRGSGENGPRDTRHPDYVQPPRLLLWTTEGIIVGYYDWYYHAGYGRGAESGVPAWRDVGGGPAYAPTHWMPLPPPPEADTQEKP